MNPSQLLAGVGLAASLLLTTTVSTALAQKAPAAGKTRSEHPDLVPSVVGGAPTTILVYNFTKKEILPIWITPNGDVQPVPDGKSLPPTGTTPATIPTFLGATVGYRVPPNGDGRWIHLTGADEKPFLMFGVPPDGFVPPEAATNAKALAKRQAQAKPGSKPATNPTGKIAAGAFKPRSGSSSVAANNSTPGSTPGAPARGRKRGGQGSDAPDINITNIKVIPIEPAIFSSAPAPEASSSAPDAASPPAASPPADDPAPATEPPTAPKAKKPFTAESPVIVEFLRIHNAARADVGAGPLEWSPDLAKNAHNWALHIAQTGRLEHQGDKYGENFGTSTGEDYTPATAANAWLSEKVNFKPDAADPYRVSKMYKDQDGKTVVRIEDGPTAHYTQMVWSKSTMVGVGTARMKSGKLIVVAFYNPRGNVKDEKPY